MNIQFAIQNGIIYILEVNPRASRTVPFVSKAIGVLGGYVAGTRDLIEFLYRRARPFLFSTSHPPAVAAACLAAIQVLRDEPELIERQSTTARAKLNRYSPRGG